MDSYSAEELISHLRYLHSLREEQKAANKLSRSRRRTLSADERAKILEKAGGRCHICGGEISNPRWQADHVLAHSGGGTHKVDNYLAAHALCNNYRWDYLEEEFQLILKLGVWIRTQVEESTPIGREVASGFTAHERRRINRTKAGISEAAIDISTIEEVTTESRP
jgi:5-methylcytosine-specific restriction endonuclease McrA